LCAPPVSQGINDAILESGIKILEESQIETSDHSGSDSFLEASDNYFLEAGIGKLLPGVNLS
jgi:hypothetical protein